MTNPTSLACRHEQSLRDFLNECAGSAAFEQEARLRDAAHLLGLSGGLSSRSAFDAMLACGAYESAALALIGAHGFILSRGITGTCLASTIAPDQADECTVEGASPALALLIAHVASLLSGQAAPAARPAMDLQGAPAGTLLH